MKDWFNHFLSDSSGELYDRMQAMRLDYGRSMRALARSTRLITANKKPPITILDVASGTATASRIASRGLDNDTVRVVALDNDCHLLQVAQQLQPSIEVKLGDMIRTQFRRRFDLIICSFAYHHATDTDKPTLCRNIRRWINDSGDLFVLEICLTREQIEPYYNHLIRKLPRTTDFPMARKFLEWTMAADRAETGEWKVSLSRVLEDFGGSGFHTLRVQKLWSPPLLDSDSGCFLLHFKPQTHGSIQRQQQPGRKAFS